MTQGTHITNETEYNKNFRSSIDDLLRTVVYNEDTTFDRPQIYIIDNTLVDPSNNRVSIFLIFGNNAETAELSPLRFLTSYDVDWSELNSQLKVFSGRTEHGEKLPLKIILSPSVDRLRKIVELLPDLGHLFFSVELLIVAPTKNNVFSDAIISQLLRELNIALVALGVHTRLRVDRVSTKEPLRLSSLQSSLLSTSLGQILQFACTDTYEAYSDLIILRTNLGLQTEIADHAPLLTVLTRTHGKRFHTLKDVFCCLSAQECTDFEHLIVAHNLDQAAKAELDKLITAQIPSYRSRIRVIHISGGNRTRPLNAGFEVSRGHYVAILDDDDIVFANWVEAFRNQSLETPGRLLRASSVRQEYEEVSINGRLSARAVSGMIDEYGRKYDHFAQFNGNLTPPVAVAFPRYFFDEFGHKFDEKLTTTEDWEYINRCSALVGVGSIEDITSIYRWWNNAYSSRVDHDPTEWRNNHSNILSQIDRRPYILGGETVMAERARFNELLQSRQWALHLNSEIDKIKNDYIAEKNGNSILEKRVRQVWSPVRGDSYLRTLNEYSSNEYVHSIINGSGMFDKQWYLDRYKDVAENGIDPLEHFVTYGSFELRSPSAKFDAYFYYIFYDDVFDNRLEPLLHYISKGVQEGRRTHI